jgi:hypothetical protein
VALGHAYVRGRFARWPRQSRPQEGISLLVPVPSDIPALTALALASLREQDRTSVVETIVLPDGDASRVQAVVDRFAEGWDGDLRVKQLRALDRKMLARVSDGALNYATQVCTGAMAARGTHIYMHDADAFLMSSDILEERLSLARRDHSAVQGIDRAWDAWFGQNGRPCPVATWEMLANVAWLREFAPWEMFSTQRQLGGEVHGFDVTFWIQCRTAPGRVSLIPARDVVHFNYVIGSFREYQRRPGRFADHRFGLLLLRLLSDMLQMEADGVPELGVFTASLAAADDSFGYRSADRDVYREWREKVAQVIDGPWCDSSSRARAVNALSPFDAHFAFSRSGA